MKRTLVQVVVEGETERDFVKRILAPHFYPKGLVFQFNLLHGVNRWGWDRVRNEIAGCIYDAPESYCTTMIDLYGLPENTPGKNQGYDRNPILWAENIEKAISQSLFKSNQRLQNFITNDRFIPYLQVHEFEALLFSEPETIAAVVDTKDCAEELKAIRNQYKTPEYINNNPASAPSRRLKKIYGSSYQKPLFGVMIAQDIGLDKIRKQCRHFNSWLSLLENIAQQTQVAN